MPEYLKRSLKLKQLETRESVNADGQKIGHLSGYLAVYGNRDFYDSMLAPGCFTKSLQERSTYPLLADHDADCPMGKFTAREDAKGLYIEAEVFLSIGYAMDKWTALKGGAIDGLSVGFSIIKRQYDEEQELLTILEARLWEGSVVTFPANELARVDALRSASPAQRKALVPLLRALEDASGMAAEILELQGGELPEAQALKIRTGIETTLTQLSTQIEALRVSIRTAATKTTEPPAGHSAEDVAELLQLCADITQAHAA